MVDWTNYVNTSEICATGNEGSIFLDGLWTYSLFPPYYSTKYGLLTVNTGHPSYVADWFVLAPGDMIQIITDNNPDIDHVDIRHSEYEGDFAKTEFFLEIISQAHFWGRYIKCIDVKLRHRIGNAMHGAHSHITNE